MRTTDDIDAAVKEKKLGLFFIHQGTALFGGAVDRVALWRQLGFGYCLLAYNQRNAVAESGGICSINLVGALVDMSNPTS